MFCQHISVYFEMQQSVHMATKTIMELYFLENVNSWNIQGGTALLSAPMKHVH